MALLLLEVQVCPVGLTWAERDAEVEFHARSQASTSVPSGKLSGSGKTYRAQLMRTRYSSKYDKSIWRDNPNCRRPFGRTVRGRRHHHPYSPPYNRLYRLTVITLLSLR